MKTVKIFAVAMIALFAASSVKAQEFKASADIVNAYVWRGTQAAGASVQPTLDFTAGGFSIGAWGSASLAEISGTFVQEADLYAKYVFGFGLSVGVTDYYYTGSSYFGKSHAFEGNLGYTIGGLSLSGNYIFNDAISAGGDTYFEIGYAFPKLSLFVGAGDGWHTPDTKFAVCNIGASTTKEIKITETFSIPLKASVILNPKTEQFFLVAGITL
ncbi:MAG: hypothetical protein ACMV0Y_06865 [Paludibacter sp.]|jgi:hypothetical protein